MCGDVDAGYSTLPEVSVVGSDCIIWWVVCCVVGASQSICKTCEGLVLLSEMLAFNIHKNIHADLPIYIDGEKMPSNKSINIYRYIYKG
jgi:hypothetical protein